MSPKIKLSGAEKDMTLDELEEAIKLARNAGAEGDSYVYAELSTSGKIKEISVSTGERTE
ncbi:hypothetical protein OG936_37605 [Streptomyces sp. NBC_00846]|uniref:hypothetical protein n=1 Tax=Streptomyces sp. NBC_00846 TaxID=2975849 RepID=UPI00386E5F99|nr:hypothetical protein OG936_37605 [Streptomyces sp. NBC_00846]